MIKVEDITVAPEYNTSVEKLILGTMFQYTEEGLPFMEVIKEALNSTDLIMNIDRLWDLNLDKIAKRTHLEKMIDEATGYDKHQITKLINIIYDIVWTRLPRVQLEMHEVAVLFKEQGGEDLIDFINDSRTNRITKK